MKYSSLNFGLALSMLVTTIIVSLLPNNYGANISNGYMVSIFGLGIAIYVKIGEKA